MSESEYESSSSSSEEDLGSDYDPADFESSSEEDDSDDEDFEAPKSGKRKATAKKSTAPAKKKTKTAAASKKTPTTKKSTAKKAPAKKTPAKKTQAKKKTTTSKSKENSSIAKNAKVSGKKKQTKKLTAQQCELAIVEYLSNTNRPYSDKEIYDNMHKPMPYAKFRTLLDKLHADDKIQHRINGKFKLYWPRQDQFENLSTEDRDKLDVEIVDKREMERNLVQELKKVSSVASSLKSQLTLEDLKARVQVLKEEHQQKSKRLADLKKVSKTIDPEERKSLIKEIKTLKKLWRDRKNNCLDIFDQIIESSGKKEKVVYENWGLETAADANGPTLKEFSNIVKAL